MSLMFSAEATKATAKKTKMKRKWRVKKRAGWGVRVDGSNVMQERL
jgi:hypothetical protein